MLEVEGAGGQENDKFGTWECSVGYVQKTACGTAGEGP